MHMVFIFVLSLVIATADVVFPVLNAAVIMFYLIKFYFCWLYIFVFEWPVPRATSDYSSDCGGLFACKRDATRVKRAAWRPSGRVAWTLLPHTAGSVACTRG